MNFWEIYNKTRGYIKDMKQVNAEQQKQEFIKKKMASKCRKKRKEM